jgi:hypothetical protein
MTKGTKSQVAPAVRAQARDDFSRPIMIHVCKDGTISYRDKTKNEPVFNGRALPVFSVDTVEQAFQIQVLFGRRMYTAHPDMPNRVWYVWTDFSGDVDDLQKCTEACRKVWPRLKETA